MKKYFNLLSLATIMLFASCGGGGNTPASIEKSMYQQFQKGNYKKGIDILMENLDATAEQKAQFSAFFNDEKIKKEAENSGGIKSFEIVKEEISEDGLSAVVETKIVYTDDTEKTQSTNYVKKDGKWYLSMGK